MSAAQGLAIHSNELDSGDIQTISGEGGLGTSSGYSITKSGATDSAAEMDRAADHVGAILRTLPAEQCSTPAAYGGEEAAPAFDNFVGAWQREAKTLHSALEEIAGKLRTTTSNYQTADQAAIGELRTAAGAATAPTPFG